MTSKALGQSVPSPERPRVVIVGAGFGGLWAARTLADAEAEVLLVDRHNYHTFLPLLYQVAAAELEPEGIATPARHILRSLSGVSFHMAEVEGIDFQRRTVTADGAPLPYDYLIVATGSASHFFGVAGAAEYAFELKTLEQGIALRNRIIASFEKATREPEATVRRKLLTFAIVGGGATGVEFAGALAELIHGPLKKDFPDLDFRDVRILLLEGGESLLPGMPGTLGAYALDRLGRLGVEVHLAAAVERVTADSVVLRGNVVLPAMTVVWTAGVRGDPGARQWGLPTAADGRVRVLPTLQVPGHGEAFVIGDLALVEAEGHPLPMIAPAAVQEGSAAAANILRLMEGKTPSPFAYRDRGAMVTIGRNAAVVRLGQRSFTGFFAWVLWLFVHFINLIGFRNRLLVLAGWAWDYLFFERPVRLILPTEGRATPKAAGEEVPPSPQLLQAIGEFNSGAYFACHETLEVLWLAETGPHRTLYQGVLQIAAALLHLQRGNYRGAVALLARGAARLEPFSPATLQLDVGRLLRETQGLRQELEGLGPERFAEWDRGLLPRLRLVTPGNRGPGESP